MREGLRSPYRNRDGGRALSFVNERGRAREVSVWSSSPLEQLRALSEKLAHWYRWEPAQSTMFVLTGDIPAVPALKVTRSSRYRGPFQGSLPEPFGAGTSVPEHLDVTITATASAWVPVRTVARAYRKAQIEVMGSGGKPPSPKNLKLFRFVNGRTKPVGDPAAEGGLSRRVGRTVMPEGKELVREWNDAHPRWAYKTSVGDPDTRRFWRDYNRIKRTVAVGPPYQVDSAATARQPE